jgi:periplasmic copper chaperone A
MTRRIAWMAAILSVCAPGLALAHEYEAGAVTVAHPWARATPGGATVGAVYVEISAKDADTLVAASSPLAGKVEIHTHTMDGGVMKMRKLEKLPISGGQSVVLKPSGDHIMLFDLKSALKEGDLLPITLVFEKAGEVQIEATVEPVGANGPHGLDHQPGHEDHSEHNQH